MVGTCFGIMVDTCFGIMVGLRALEVMDTPRCLWNRGGVQLHVVVIFWNFEVTLSAILSVEILLFG